MNGKFIRKIEETGKTIYNISKETGIPYTTLSDLIREKTGINKASAETVYLLSLYLNCPVADILDEFPLIRNVSGKYRNIKYKWEFQNKMELHIWDGNVEKIISNGYACNQERFFTSYKLMTEMLIDYYLEEKEITFFRKLTPETVCFLRIHVKSRIPESSYWREKLRVFMTKKRECLQK